LTILVNVNYKVKKI